MEISRTGNGDGGRKQKIKQEDIKMEDIELMTVIKERIDRLTEKLTMDEQKITFLEQSLDKQRSVLEKLKAEKNVLEQDSAAIRGKIKA